MAPELIGEQIDVRFDPETYEQVHVYQGDNPLGLAKPVNFSDNAKTKRVKKSTGYTMSFHNIQGKGDDDSV